MCTLFSIFLTVPFVVILWSVIKFSTNNVAAAGLVLHPYEKDLYKWLLEEKFHWENADAVVEELSNESSITVDDSALVTFNAIVAFVRQCEHQPKRLSQKRCAANTALLLGVKGFTKENEYRQRGLMPISEESALISKSAEEFLRGAHLLGEIFCWQQIGSPPTIGASNRFGDEQQQQPAAGEKEQKHIRMLREEGVPAKNDDVHIVTNALKFVDTQIEMHADFLSIVQRFLCTEKRNASIFSKLLDALKRHESKTCMEVESIPKANLQTLLALELMLLIAPIKFSAYSDAQRVETIIPLAIVYGYGSGDVNALLHNFKATEPVAHRLLRFFMLFNKLEEHTGRRVPEHLIVEVLDDYIDLLVRITDQLRKYFNLEMRNGPLVETLWFIEDRNDQNRVISEIKRLTSEGLSNRQVRSVLTSREHSQFFELTLSRNYDWSVLQKMIANQKIDSTALATQLIEAFSIAAQAESIKEWRKQFHIEFFVLLTLMDEHHRREVIRTLSVVKIHQNFFLELFTISTTRLNSQNAYNDKNNDLAHAEDKNKAVNVEEIGEQSGTKQQSELNDENILDEDIIYEEKLNIHVEDHRKDVPINESHSNNVFRLVLFEWNKIFTNNKRHFNILADKEQQMKWHEAIGNLKKLVEKENVARRLIVIGRLMYNNQCAQLSFDLGKLYEVAERLADIDDASLDGALPSPKTVALGKASQQQCSGLLISLQKWLTPNAGKSRPTDGGRRIGEKMNLLEKMGKIGGSLRWNISPLTADKTKKEAKKAASDEVENDGKKHLKAKKSLPGLRAAKSLNNIKLPSLHLRLPKFRIPKRKNNEKSETKTVMSDDQESDGPE